MASFPQGGARHASFNGSRRDRRHWQQDRDGHDPGMIPSHRNISPLAATHDKPRNNRGNSPGFPVPCGRGRSVERPRPHPLPDPPRRRDRSREYTGRDAFRSARPPPPSPPSQPLSQGKKPRSRSPPSATGRSYSKKSRRGPSPPAPDRRPVKTLSGASDNRRPAPGSGPQPSQPRSPGRQVFCAGESNSSRSSTRTGPGRSGSPRRGALAARGHHDDRLNLRQPLLRRPDRSPLPSLHGRSSPPPLGQPIPSEAVDYRQPEFRFEPSRVDVRPPQSPREGPRPRKKKTRRKGKGKSPKEFDPGTGANSVEVNMATRGSFNRGGPKPQPQNNFPRGQFNQGAGDSRPFSQSSGHGTPNSSFHGSSRSQSPHGGSGRGWNNTGQFSPNGLNPSQHASANFQPPTAPQSHFLSNSPPHAPNGPAAQYAQGPYRGGRGGGGGPRGNNFGARGGQRGNFKNMQWNTQGGNGRGPDASHNSNHSSPKPSDHSQSSGFAAASDGDNPFRPSKDLQVEDAGTNNRAREEQMPPPSRPPPTGPQSQTPNKFSFSMKNASKPVVAAPRPEISSKFNAAAPPRREQETTQQPKQPPKGPSKPDRGGKGLPRNVPTEPASARARIHEPRQPESRKMDPAPRIRMVKKIMTRPKSRPKLAPDMAKSRSVFFRKPGNESVVGSGTYGKVFKGLNVYTQKLVALKKIRMEGERDGFPVTAVREIKLLRSLKHRNVVELQEVMVEANECFMVFEYLSHDLTGLLNHPAYEVDLAVRKNLALQLFEGLDYLHTRGVLHRDIKAANILVSNEGILKLADFGLARFYAKRHQLDYTNRVITIWYRSPELLLGETRYGPAVDIWSAACVMYEIFTKHAIFPGDGSEINQLEKIYAVLGTPNKVDWPNLTEMPWFELLRPAHRKSNVFEEKYKERLPGAAFEIVASMLQYDPDKRPTAAQVLAHPYFTKEEPVPRQATELKDIPGDWHEFESKALKREKERAEKQRRAAKEAVAGSGKDQGKEASSSKDVAPSGQEKERKRPNEATEGQPDPKRLHVEGKTTNAEKPKERDREVGSNPAVKSSSKDLAPSKA